VRADIFGSMYVCLSSGARPRYRRDIIRALAMPTGTWIQFRYAREWVAPAILADLVDAKKRKALAGKDVLISYVDQTELQQDPELLPCRMASLVDVVPLGRTVSLQLELADFALASDLTQFNDEAKSLAGDVFPRREADGLKGAYWFEISRSPNSIARSSGLATWESIVQQVATRPDFQEEHFFYTVEGLVDVAPTKPLAAKRNMFHMRANREYDLRIYHYHPTHGDPRAQIGLETSHASLSFTTNPEVLLDSRYDLKRIRLRTMAPESREPGVLTIRRQEQGKPEWEWEFDLPIQVRATFWRKIGFGLLVGCFLAVSPIVGAYSNPSLSAGSRQVISLVAIVTGILAGVTAAFGLRRSL
jgi:hypothetical protein